MEKLAKVNFQQPELISRRQMLTCSGMGFGAVAAATLLQADRLRGSDASVSLRPDLDALPRAGHVPGPAKAVIQLVMTGGPSQMDLLDPKPVLNARHDEVYEIKIDAFQNGSKPNKLLGTPFKFQKAGRCGMDMSDVFTHLPQVADDICLVRSLVSVHNNHTEGIVNLACGKMFIGRPTLGAWISYGLGTENQNLPAFVVLRDPDGYSTSGGLMSKSGWMPALYGGTEFNTRGPVVDNLRAAREVPAAVLRTNLEFLAQLNERHRRQFADDSELETRIKNYELAARMQLSATGALDLAGETEATRRMYGLDRAETASYGTRCLMARRLVEQGVRFVQVFSEKGQPWDHHAGLEKGLRDMCRKTDPGTVGLIQDLKQRGLLDSTIVIWSGEFGRMPVAQNAGGRDHNKRAGCMLLAGGGFKRGFTYGETDDVGYTAVQNPFSVPDMFATVLHQLGIDHRRLVYKHAGRYESATDDVVTGANVHSQIIETPLRI
jgi:hypothetical protein